MEDGGNQAALSTAPLLDSSPAPSAEAQGRRGNWMLENSRCHGQCPVFFHFTYYLKKKKKKTGPYFSLQKCHTIFIHFCGTRRKHKTFWAIHKDWQHKWNAHSTGNTLIFLHAYFWWKLLYLHASQVRSLTLLYFASFLSSL